jgi:hypothetical protein
MFGIPTWYSYKKSRRMRWEVWKMLWWKNMKTKDYFARLEEDNIKINLNRM